MTSVQQALAGLSARLTGAGIPDAALEAQVLVMHATGWDRARLFAAFREAFPPQGEALEGMAQRRLKREPLAYITGHREFFGLDFLVDRRVLIPRQETECLVEQVLGIVLGQYPERAVSIADVGTGSGAIAIALAKSLPKAHVYATDASSAALEVAEANVQRHSLEKRITLLHGDLLAPVLDRVDIVAGNLPYIPIGEWQDLQPEIRLYEPQGALLSGERGLDAIERLLRHVEQLHQRPTWLVLELATGQAAEVISIAQTLLTSVQSAVFKDLGGLERGVILRLQTGS